MKKTIYTVIETFTILVAIISLYLFTTRDNDILAAGAMLGSGLINLLMLAVDGEEECADEA